ncbi:MAG: hypothetical protein EBY22_11520, partial [Gammaproteobacteria bacterium]|nr:hypothetical protein [Gammaproteobacteria bacterium]
VVGVGHSTRWGRRKRDGLFAWLGSGEHSSCKPNKWESENATVYAMLTPKTDIMSLQKSWIHTQKDGFVLLSAAQLQNH